MIVEYLWCICGHRHKSVVMMPGHSCIGDKIERSCSHKYCGCGGKHGFIPGPEKQDGDSQENLRRIEPKKHQMTPSYRTRQQKPSAHQTSPAALSGYVDGPPQVEWNTSVNRGLGGWTWKW